MVGSVEMLLKAPKTGVVVSAVDADGASQDQVGPPTMRKKTSIVAQDWMLESPRLRLSLRGLSSHEK